MSHLYTIRFAGGLSQSIDSLGLGLESGDLERGDPAFRLKLGDASLGEAPETALLTQQ